MSELMEPFSEFNTLVWTLAELFVVLFLVIYTIFAVVIIKQVKLMFRTLQVGLEEPIKFVAYSHFFISVAVLIFSFLILLF